MRSAFLVLLSLAVPAAFAQSEGSARQVLEECVRSIEPDVLGLEDIEETCPDVRVALEELGLTDLVSENQLSVLNRDGLDGLRALVSRYEKEPERGVIDTESLAPLLESLRKPPPVAEQSLSWYERLKRWLHELFKKKQTQADADTESWLSRWLDEHPLPEVVRWVLIYGSIALVVLLALGIVINEVRVAARGRRRKSASAMAADLPRAAGAAGLDLESGGERLSALLKMLIATLIETGRLNGAQSLTHRELTKRARFDDSTQRESFQKIAQLAEREVFGGKAVASDDLGEALRVGRSLDAQLKAAAT